MTNPDYDPELYRFQDREIETIPKDMENRDLGYVLEAAGDIFRELTARQQPDDYYIGEKWTRIERTLGNRVDRENTFAQLSEADQDRADELKEKWFGMKSLSARLVAVRNLNIALADQNEQGVQFNLRRFKEEHTRSPRRREPEVMHCVHEGKETLHERIGPSRGGISRWRCTACGQSRSQTTPSRRPAEVRVRGHRRRT